jgi:hypothetical protein
MFSTLCSLPVCGPLVFNGYFYLAYFLGKLMSVFKHVRKVTSVRLSHFVCLHHPMKTGKHYSCSYTCITSRLFNCAFNAYVEIELSLSFSLHAIKARAEAYTSNHF